MSDKARPTPSAEIRNLIEERANQQSSGQRPLARPPIDPHIAHMDDKDVQRLEDRIDAVNREGQLRLDAAMARIDGKFDVITASLAELRDGIGSTRTLVIGSAFVVLFGVLGILIGLKQVWIGGVQVGQTIQTTAAPAQPKP
jgi:hypothetical protein